LISHVELSLGELIFQFSMFVSASLTRLLLLGTAWVCGGGDAWVCGGGGDAWVCAGAGGCKFVFL
jgi:hypothetical protein